MEAFHEYIITLGSISFGFLVGFFFPSYFNQKGRNLATKEDIGEITDKIEEVKSKFTNHSHRYTREYEILSQLTDYLIELRLATESLRPTIDYINPDEPEWERKDRRLGYFHKARRDLYMVREKKRPFYPEYIYQQIIKIDDIVYNESLDYECFSSKEQREEYWNSATENRKSLIQSLDLAMEAIRERVTLWDSNE